jgi:putrescine importer
MSETTSNGGQQGQLKRTLGLWSIVGLGLGYMTPTVVFDTFGIVSEKTGGVVPTAYLIALGVMLLTALSYGKMTVVFPSAGSAYTYTSATLGPRIGFLIAWSALLDYILLPLVNAVIIRSYMASFFPSVPTWIWVFLYAAAITWLCRSSTANTSRLNMILVLFVVVLIIVDIVLSAQSLMNGMGTGTIFTLQPLWHEGVQMSNVLAGATIVAFSFIGFDAITMYTEEAKDVTSVPKAIMLSLFIGGAIFFTSALFTQSVFPDLSQFNSEAIHNSALPQIAFLIGGNILMSLLAAGAFAATVASSLASQSSVSRLLYVMGRNGNGPISRFFGSLHPTHGTPANAVVFVGAVALLAIPLNLEFVASLINFGALIAFTSVNLSVILLFAVRRREFNTAGQVIRNILLPLAGIVMTIVMWLHLSPESTIYGTIWFAIGLGALLWLTRFFKRPLTMSMGDGHG